MMFCNLAPASICGNALGMICTEAARVNESCFFLWLHVRRSHNETPEPMIHFALDNVALQTLNYKRIEFLWASISQCLHHALGNMSYEWIIGSYSGPRSAAKHPFLNAPLKLPTFGGSCGNYRSLTPRHGGDSAVDDLRPVEQWGLCFFSTLICLHLLWASQPQTHFSRSSVIFWFF